MDIKKHFDFETLIRIKFLQLEVEDKKINSQYFIDKIEEGINEQNNMNNKTNLTGKMTSFKYFVQDKKLYELLNEIFHNFPKNIIISNLMCIDAWGIKSTPGDETFYHKHDSSYSAILYLTDSNTSIHFPEIKTHILPKKNNFLFFSSILEHGTKKMIEDTKYAIAMNFIYKKSWE